MHHPNHCLNCSTQLHQTDKFCCNCGQSTHAESRITIHHITHEVMHAVTHTDKGFFYLIRSLALQPGHTVKEYLAGKHKKYYSPFSFFFIVLGIYVLSNSIFKPFSARYDNTVGIENTRYPANIKTTKQRAKFDRIQKRADVAINFINTRTNVVLCISTPFIAFIMFLIYRKQMFYAEHLVVMTFVNSFLNLLSVFVFTPLLYFAHGGPVYFTILICMILSHFVYASIVYFRVLDCKRTVTGYLKCAGSVVVGIMGWIVLSYIIIGGYIMSALL